MKKYNLGSNKVNRIGYCSRSILAIACALAITQSVYAQTSTAPTTIPLDVILEDAGGGSFDRIGINVGVNGATPEEYIFDTGSTSFNIAVGAGSAGQPWFPIVPGTTITPNFPAFNLYGDGTYGNLGASSTVGSVQFYNSSSNVVSASFTNKQGLPVLINQGNVATQGSLGGDQAGAQVGYFLPDYGYAFTFAEIATYGLDTSGGVPMYLDATWQKNLDAGIGPEDGGSNNLFGIFGAGEFGSDSVLGNLTTSGYIVAANGQRGDPQNCSGCGHVILNLTPALRAQFISLVPWNGGANGSFPLSGAPISANQFDLAFAYTLNGGKYSATLQTLLDSGTPTIYLNDAGLLAEETASGQVNEYGDEIPGVTLTMTGAATGAQPTSILTGDDTAGDQSNVVTPGPNPYTSQGQALYGVSFFFNNSVMYDLENQETGYTPFFVSIDPISTGTTGYTVSSSMSAQGIAGIISGSGPFVVSNYGAAQLTGANTYTGLTYIANDGWLGLAGPGTIADSSGVQADGTFDISRGYAPALIQSLSGAGNVALGANTLELTNASGTFSGTLADNGLGGGTGGSVIIARGMETLAGNSTYTGSTGISPQGALMLNGSLAGSVLDAGVLAGQGKIGGGLVVTGVVAPGNAAGNYQTLAVAGNYLQSTGAIYAAQIAPGGTGTSSLIAVTGSAALGTGAMLDVLVHPTGQSFIKGTQYTLLSAQQGLTGTYTLAGDTKLSAVLGVIAGYDRQHAYLSVVQTRALTALVGTSNETATLSAVQSLSPSQPIFAAVTNMSTDRQILGAADQLSGEMHASIQNTFLEDSHYLRDAVTGRLRQTLPDAPAAGANQTSAPAVQTQTNGLSWWGQFMGAWGNQNGNGNAAPLSHSLVGFLIGADAPLSVGENGRLGVASSYTQTSFYVNQRGSRGFSHDGSLSLYAGTQFGPLALSLGTAYTQHLITTTRIINLPGFNTPTVGNYKASTSQVFGEAGYLIEHQTTTFEPFAQAAYVRLNSDGFKEHGSAAALIGSGNDRAVTYTTLGGHLVSRFPLNGDTMTVHATLGWRRAFGNVTPTSTLGFDEGTSFTVDGLPIARDALVVDTGVELPAGKNVSISLSYNGQIGRHAVDSGFRGSVVWKF